MSLLSSAYRTQEATPVATKAADTARVKQQQKEEQPRHHRTSRQAKRALVLGFKGGVNRSRVYDSQGEAFAARPKTGFAAGAFLAIPFDGFSGLQPEVLISQKGFHSSGSINNDPYTLDRRDTYLDVPLHLQLKPFRFFSVLLGVQYSRLLRQSDSFTYGTNRVEQQKEFDSENPRTNLFSTSVGFDVNIRHLVLSYRVCRDLLSNKGSGSPYTPRYKNAWFQVTLGYRLY